MASLVPQVHVERLASPESRHQEVKLTLAAAVSARMAHLVHLVHLVQPDKM